MISVSRLAVIVGLAGLLPFLGATASLVLLAAPPVGMMSFFYLYSAAILAFMAGVYWPLAMQLEHRCYPQSPLVTMLISQGFFVTAGVGVILPVSVQAVLYTVAFIVLYQVDARWMRSYWPRWYLRLRLVLTCVVVACQGTVGLWYFMAH